MVFATMKSQCRRYSILAILLSLHNVFHAPSPIIISSDVTFNSQEQQKASAVKGEVEIVDFSLRVLNTNITRPASSLTMAPYLKGGVVVFYHVYKTGGTTVRMSFANLTTFRRSAKGKKFIKDCKVIDNILAGNQTVKDTLFLEVHIEYPAASFPTMYDIEPLLQKWKRMSAANSVPFFSFTLLREPVSFAISYFNFFFARRWRWSPYKPMILNETNFVRTFAPNRQLLILATDPDAVWRHNITRQHLVDAQRILRDAFDWVGTTDRLQTETLPLLSLLITGNATLGQSFEAKNVFKRKDMLRYSDLNATGRAVLAAGTVLDQELYNGIEVMHSYKVTRARLGF